MGKALKNFLITIICIIALIGVVVIGGYIYVRSRYNIDLFRTVGQLKTLTQTVDESKLCPYAFESEDFNKLKTVLNAQLVEGFVKYEEGTGYEGYSINYSTLSSVTIPHTTMIILSEKQTGALAEIVFNEQTGGKINVGEKQLETNIVQIHFSNINEDGSADFNIVLKIDLTLLKNDIKDFPYNLFKKYIPNNLYISSTVRINKTDNLMGYTTTHKEFKINNLSADDTDDLFHTLDAIIKIGSAESLNSTISTAVINALIGNDTHLGYAYSLKSIGKTQFGFVTLDNIDYFSVL